MSKLRDMLLSNVEELENELDDAFAEGETQARVYIEELFGLNGETPNAVGHVTIEDVANVYRRAMEFLFENGGQSQFDLPTDSLGIMPQFIELPSSSLEVNPLDVTVTSIPQPDGFSGEEEEWGDYTAGGPVQDVDAEDVLFVLAF